MFSPVLNDDDLGQIASTQSSAHRLAICERPEISVRVSDLLLTFDDDNICLALIKIQEPRSQRKERNDPSGRRSVNSRLRSPHGDSAHTPSLGHGALGG